MMTPSSARVAIALALRLARLSATGVRHGLAMSLITALLAALTACGQPPVDDVASSTASAVVVSPNDERAYDLITLSNGIEVILVSDSTAEKSAAALSVGLGAASDPEDYPGMAHYLEHMLFMGSRQFPEPDGFMAFAAGAWWYDQCLHRLGHYQLHDAGGKRRLSRSAGSVLQFLH